MGAEETVINPNMKRMSMVGKEIRVKNGPYKQHMGVIKKDFGDRLQIELTSKQKCIMLSESDFTTLDVAGDSEDPNSSTKETYTNAERTKTPQNDWVQTPSHQFMPMTPGAGSMAGTPFRDPIWMANSSDLNLNNSIAASSP